MKARVHTRVTSVMAVVLSFTLMFAWLLTSRQQAMAAVASETESTLQEENGILSRSEKLSDGDHLAILNAERTQSLGESSGSVVANAESASYDEVTYHAEMTVMDAVATDGGFYLMCDGEFLSVAPDDTLLFADETSGSCVWQVKGTSGGLVSIWCTTSGDEARYLAFVDGGFAVSAAEDASTNLSLFSTKSHLFKEVRKEPTCTEDGSVTRTCVACGETVEVTLEASGHDWGAWEVTEKATMTEDGAETRTCRNDPNHTETRVIPKASSEPTDVSITYDLAGGTLENVSDTLTVMSSAGAQIIMLDAPEREGYVFMYWESPRYRLNPGDSYSVTSDDTFTAVWRYQTLRDALEDAEGIKSSSSGKAGADRLETPFVTGGTIPEGKRPSAKRTESSAQTKPANEATSPNTPGTQDTSIGVHVLVAVCAAGLSLLVLSRLLRRV